MRLASGLLAAPALLLAASPAMADYSTAVAAGVAAGTAAGAASSPYAAAVHEMPPEVLGTELDDWLDARTGSTAALRNGCGQDVELHLSRTSTLAYLNVTVANNSGHTVSLVKDDVQVRFGTGLVRRLKPVWPSEDPLRNGWSNHYTFLFPAKRDFEGQSSLVVSLPFLSGASSCVLQTQVQRDIRVPPDPRTYTNYDAIELFAGGGVTFGAVGGLGQNVRGLGAIFDIGFGGFPNVNFGYFFDIPLATSGTSAGPLADQFGAPTRRPRLQSAGFFAGPAFRLYPSTWLEASLRPSIGAYFFDVTNPNDDKDTRERGAFAVRTTLRALVRVAQLSDGSRMWLGPELVHLAVPHVTFNGANLSGQDFGALLAFSWGG